MNASFGLLATALLVCACSAPPPPAASAPTAVEALAPPTEAEALSVTAGYDAALATDDAAALAAFYAPEATRFSAELNPLGEAVTAESLSAFVAMKPKAQLNARTIQIVDADTFVDTGIVSYDIEGAGKAAWIARRFTRVYERQSNGDWRIAHEHLSTPPEPLTTRPAPLASGSMGDGADPQPLGDAAPTP